MLTAVFNVLHLLFHSIAPPCDICATIILRTHLMRKLVIGVLYLAPHFDAFISRALISTAFRLGSRLSPRP
jgi:hypothetical protein